MEVVLGGDIAVGLATGDDVRSAADSLAARMHGDRGIYKRVNGSTVVQNPGALQVNSTYSLVFGTPSPGYVWVLRSLYFDVAGTNPFTQVNAAKGILAIGVQPDTIERFNYADYLIPALTTPTSMSWTRKAYVAHTGEYVYMVLSTGATVDYPAIYANLGIEELREEAFQAGMI